MNETPELISAVIPSWNRRDDLLACIASLKQQEGVQLEIIVVDDASSDDTLAGVRLQHPDVRIIEGTFQCGHPHRRNQGIRAARGEYILHLDNDIEFPDARTVFRMLERFKADTSIGAIGGEIAKNTGLLDRAWGLMLGRMDYPDRVAVTAADGPRDCDFLPSLNYLTRRDLMLQIQGYDPYYEFGAPDMDLCYKIREAGKRIVLSFDCAAIHKAAGAGRRKDASYKYCLNGVRFCLRHHGFVIYLARLGWYTLRIGARLLVGKGGDELSGPRALLRAYWWSFFHLAWIRSTLRSPFLSDVEQERFEAWKQGGT